MIEQDYHVHCLNSPDSKEPLENICEAAIQAGLKEIMITDHYELFSEKYHVPNYRREYLEQCVRAVEKCQKQFQNDIYVGLGIELGQWHLDPCTAEQIVREYPFDYVIASFHKLDDVDLKMLSYAKLDIASLRLRYLKGVLEIAQIGDFDVMGHLDLIKRYAASQNISIRIEEEENLVREILRTLIKRKKGLEINTSGLRQSVGETFPSYTILQWYREDGGKIITIGSDAHCAADVGAGFKEAEIIMQKLGLSSASIYRKHKRMDG